MPMQVHRYVCVADKTLRTSEIWGPNPTLSLPYSYPNLKTIWEVPACWWGLKLSPFGVFANRHHWLLLVKGTWAITMSNEWVGIIRYHCAPGKSGLKADFCCRGWDGQQPQQLGLSPVKLPGPNTGLCKGCNAGVNRCWADWRPGNGQEKWASRTITFRK